MKVDELKGIDLDYWLVMSNTIDPERKYLIKESGRVVYSPSSFIDEDMIITVDYNYVMPIAVKLNINIRFGIASTDYLAILKKLIIKSVYGEEINNYEN